MCDDRQWMYDVSKKNGAHIDEWWDKTSDFIERGIKPKIRCPCMKCQNARCFDKVILTSKHLVKYGFTADYETWVFYGKKYTVVAAEESMND
jgi:hypothetical protein